MIYKFCVIFNSNIIFKLNLQAFKIIINIMNKSIIALSIYLFLQALLLDYSFRFIAENLAEALMFISVHSRIKVMLCY